MKWKDINTHKPPQDTPILVFVNHIVDRGDGTTYENFVGQVIVQINNEVNPYSRVVGVYGYEWESEFDYEHITHWKPLCSNLAIFICV